MTRSSDFDPTAPKQLLNRHQGNWHQRLAVGLSLDRKFTQVDSALLLCKGCGKWLQHQWSELRTIEIPPAMSKECQRIANSTDVQLNDFLQIKSDLCEVFAVAAKSAIALSGKAADRLMAIGVSDPGLWTKEFDGRPNFQTFCDPDRLADQTGLTVVDAFPVRDITNGGNGKPIDLLALWLLFADRNSRVACEFRAIVRITDVCRITILPPSDGLDDEYPPIRYRELPIGNLKQLDWLFENLQQMVEAVVSTGSGVNSKREVGQRRVLIHLFCETPELASLGQLIPEIAATRTTQELSVHQEQPSENRAVESEQSLSAKLAGMLSFMHLDQMPASLPWINGTDSPRTLGRITPGSPTNWRQVIINMADFRPPAMKLRDAI